MMAYGVSRWNGAFSFTDPSAFPYTQDDDA